MLNTLENEKTDEEIAKLVQGGDGDFFGVLMARYEAKLKRYGKKFLAGDASSVEDAVQETFMKAYRSIKDFDATRKFSSWIYRIAHNEFVNVLKTKKREPLLFFDADTLFPHPVAPEKSDKEAEKNLISQGIEKCLDKLNPKYREALILYYLEDLGYKEIADILRIPVSTVGIRLKRGKEAVKLICKNNGLDTNV